MLQLSKPRKNRGKPDSFWHMDEPAKLKALEDYCVQDVATERAIDRMITDLPGRSSASRSWTARPTTGASSSI